MDGATTAQSTQNMKPERGCPWCAMEEQLCGRHRLMFFGDSAFATHGFSQSVEDFTEREKERRRALEYGLHQRRKHGMEALLMHRAE